MVKRFVLSLICVFAIHCLAQAQNFNDYFEDKTLRICYLHIGNFQEETLEIDHFVAGGTWNGPART